MKIHLHGDSWCYLWPRHYEPENIAYLHEEGKFYGKMLARNTPGVVAFSPLGNKDTSDWGHSLSKSQAIDFYDQMFGLLGHEVINAGVPGVDLETVVDWIQLDDLQSDADIHIVMTPFMFRCEETLSKISNEILQSVEKLCDYMADKQKFYIQQICDHAEKTKTHYIIIGAHGPLSGKCDEVLNEYSHIMYHDWLRQFIWEVAPNYEEEKERLKKKPEYFRFATTINYKKVHLESWGEDVIGMISNHLESGRGNSYLAKLIFPDMGHPNAMVMHDMVTKILRYADKLGIN